MSQTIASQQDQTIERTLEVERAVLSGILVDQDLLVDAKEHITSADFFRLPHRYVFDAFVKLADAGKPIDPISVRLMLTPEELAEVGGAYGIDDIGRLVPQGMNVGFYAQQVLNFSTKRQLVATARKILASAEETDKDASELLDNSERAIFALRDRTVRVGLIAPFDRAVDTARQVEALTAARGALQGVPTGLRDLDADLRGMRAGNLLLLGARPSMGKSALALTIAVNASTATGRPALFFSLEMSADELNLREVTMRARVDSWRLNHNRISDSDQMRLATAIQDMKEGGVHLVDAPILTVGQISAISRRMKASHGLSVILIDYVQLLTPESKRGGSQENRTLELGAMSRQLKGMARELGVPVVLLSQLSRGVESRSDKRPQLSDLRESGSLEQDADVCLLLYRPNAYEDIRKTAQYSDQYTEAIIAKQRNGPTGPVKLAFIREHTFFTNYVEGAA